ncbi:hypothetical protein FJ443_25440 [Mesorhizobium sp. B2-6-1]|nr:hypothetical protein FJ443_25440 [Mesorhizobium sp. B2-6-1]
MGKHFGTATRISVEQYAAIKQSCSAVYGRRSTQNESFPEGKLFETRHKRRERSKALINRTKSIFKRENDGRLFCEVCGFDFGAFYGELGHNFIEVHHTIPVHTLRDRDKSRVEDMAVVCSNCHRMLDRRRPWLRKAQIKNILA